MADKYDAIQLQVDAVTKLANKLLDAVKVEFLRDDKITSDTMLYLELARDGIFKIETTFGMALDAAREDTSE